MDFHRNRAKQEEPRKIPRRGVIDRVYRDGEEVKLTMEVRVRLTSGDEKTLKVWIDTGDEAKLIKEGVLPKNEFVRAEKRLFFVTANGRPMKGGETLVDLDLIFAQESVRHIHDVSIDAHFYEADISADAILGCPWMIEKGVGVYPTGGCLFMKTG